MLFTAAFNVGMGSLTWTVATEMLPVRDESTLSRENALESSINQIIDNPFDTVDETIGAQIEAVDAHGVERDVQPVVVRGDQDLQGRLRARLPRRALPHLRRRLRLRILLHSHLSPRDQARIDALLFNLQEI